MVGDGDGPVPPLGGALHQLRRGGHAVHGGHGGVAVELHPLFLGVVGDLDFLDGAHRHRAHGDVPVEFVIGHLPLGQHGDPRLQDVGEGGAFLLLHKELQVDGAGVVGDADGEDGFAPVPDVLGGHIENIPPKDGAPRFGVHLPNLDRRGADLLPQHRRGGARHKGKLLEKVPLVAAAGASPFPAAGTLPPGPGGGFLPGSGRGHHLGGVVGVQRGLDLPVVAAELHPGPDLEIPLENGGDPFLHLLGPEELPAPVLEADGKEALLRVIAGAGADEKAVDGDPGGRQLPHHISQAVPREELRAIAAADGKILQKAGQTQRRLDSRKLTPVQQGIGGEAYAHSFLIVRKGDARHPGGRHRRGEGGVSPEKLSKGVQNVCTPVCSRPLLTAAPLPPEGPPPSAPPVPSGQSPPCGTAGPPHFLRRCRCRRPGPPQGR